jgi:uroporphyrinogen decarboxylase
LALEVALNKIERVTCALKGDEVDRPPYSFWYHFGLQHMAGRDHARAEVDFYRAYDPDFLKVMSDYPYPLPDGLEVIETQDDWRRIEPVDATDECWQEQLTALSTINEAIGNEALFIETIFSPWTTARRICGRGAITDGRNRFPELVLAAMDNIATSLASYAAEAITRGAAGLFLSLGAATDDVMSADEYSVWCRPFDLKVLEAVRDAPFNVLHIHGNRIHFDSLLDYPVSALNWSYHSAGPSLKDGRENSARAVLGGINEITIAHSSPPEIREQVKETLQAVGRRGLLITPGCSVATDTPERNLRAVKAAVEEAI